MKNFKEILELSLLAIVLTWLAALITYNLEKDLPTDYSDIKVQVKTLPQTNSKIINYKFDKGISLTGYQDFIELLDKAQLGDEIKIEINSGGGSMTRMFEIVSHMQKTKAKLTCEITRLAASGAAVVAFNCGELKIKEGAYILVHLPYFNVTQDGVEYTVRDPETNEMFSTEMEKNYCLKEFLGENLFKRFNFGFDVALNKAFVDKNKDKLCKYNSSYGIAIGGHK